MFLSITIYYYLKYIYLDVTALLDQLTEPQLKNLEKHKYNAEGVSLLDPLYIPWWNKARVVRFIFIFRKKI